MRTRVLERIPCAFRPAIEPQSFRGSAPDRDFLRWMTAKKALPLAFVVAVEGFAQAIEKVAIFDLAPIGPVHVGPQQRARLGIDERNSRMTGGNRLLANGVDSLARRELTLGHDADAVAVVEAQNKVGSFAASGEFKAAPLGQFEHRAVLELVKAGFVLEEDGARVNDGVWKRSWPGPGPEGSQGQEQHSGEEPTHSARVRLHSLLPTD